MFFRLGNKEHGESAKVYSLGAGFEFLLAEWHVTPDYILANWTSEMFEMMIDKLVERKQRETESLQGHRPANSSIPAEQFFNMTGIKYKKVKR